MQRWKSGKGREDMTKEKCVRLRGQLKSKKYTQDKGVKGNKWNQETKASRRQEREKRTQKKGKRKEEAGKTAEVQVRKM